MRHIHLLVLFCTLFLKQCAGNTQPPNQSTTTEQTTTAAQETTTTMMTTTTEGTTTSTDAPTTTAQQTDATTTVVPPTNCGDNANGLFLPFGSSNGDTRLAQSDDGCQMIRPNGYSVPFADRCFSRFHICTNGLVCFNSAYENFIVPNHGQSLSAFSNKYCMAPFLMDLSTITSGDIWFQTYDTTTDCTLQNDPAITKAKELVNTQTGGTSSSFNPVFVLVVTWDSVPALGSTDTVTFQLIYATDAVNAYSFYVYKSGGMGISTRDAFIGQVVDGEARGVFGAPVSDSEYRAADTTLTWSNANDCQGGFAYSHTSRDCTESGLTCKKWHSCELQNVNTYQGNFNTFADCPCTLNQAATSADFDYTPADLNGFTGKYFYIPSTSVTVNFGKTCGYRSPAFNFIRAGRYRGSYTKYNKKTDPTNYALEDVYYKDVCCGAGLCDLYFDVRPPSDECQTTQQESAGTSGGDPHFVTLDRLRYTFNGHGEYHLLIIQGIGFSIQARTGLVQANGSVELQATVFTGFAVKGNNIWMQVNLNSDRTIMYVRAGSANELSQFKDYADEYFVDDLPGISLRRSGNTLDAKFPESGVRLIVTNSNGVLQMLLTVNQVHKTLTSGLLGNYNDNTNDDLIPKGSQSEILSTSSEEAIFNNFGRTWMTTAGDSNFYYGNGKSHASYNFQDFVPNFFAFTDAQLTDARIACGGDKRECVYDYLVSGDLALATGTSESFQAYADAEVIANNLVPNIDVMSGATQINNEYYLYATVNQASALQVKATDDGTVTTGLTSDINGSQRTNNADGSVTAAFTLTDLNSVSLSFNATDNIGEVVELDITVVVCSGCSSHGTCNFTTFQQTSTTVDLFRIAACDCEPYWDGDNCEADYNGCENSPCIEGQTCTDTNADANKANTALPAYTCSACPTGFTDGVNKCEDIDECSPTSPCTDATCANTVGSYVCDCNTGFRQDAVTGTCKDINECDESSDDCDQECVNIAGSFTCSCFTGYIRNGAGTACVIDVNNTVVENACTAAGCDAADGCTLDSEDNAACFCNTGYTLNDTDNTCSDTNECDLGICSQGCSNTVGSFTCSCYIGFVLHSDKVTCNACTFPSYGMNCAQDASGCNTQQATYDTTRGCVCNTGWEGSLCADNINECLDENICGDVNKLCTDTRGSYTCNCRDGYQEQEDGTCADLDECTDISKNTCEQVCTNTIGSFTCGCDSGYNVDSGDATQCTDINECTDGISGCEQLCYNIDGGFNCECYAGFELNADRKTCRKLEDLCLAFTTTACSDICTVVANAPVCSCNTGYILGSDDQTCIDVDECGSDTLNLCSVKTSCVNTEGAYTCSCAAGFRLENDQRTCTACNDQTYGVNCANNCNCGVGAEACDSVTGCACMSGWTGDKCDADRDECQSSPCQADEACTNTPGSYECGCRSGYSKNQGGTCVNINECDDPNLNTCQHVCTDTEGSFECSCNPGFVQDGNNCNDINECEGDHGCEQTCTNVIGSFRCSCPDNYQLNDDKQTCTATNACDNPGICSDNALCANISGVDTCTCNTGFQYDTDSSTQCVDIKECSNSNLNKCNQKCNELSGSYSCTCDQDGFHLDVDEHTCIECDEGTYGANCAQTCDCEIDNSNTKSCDKVDGTCTCNSGWEGTICENNINECDDVNPPCPGNSACVDNDGSYTCLCSIGYVKTSDGTCSECDATHYGQECIHECACVTANTDDCDAVSGDCTCANGWNGTDCSENIDECQTQNICNDSLKTCTDTPGSFECSCIDGYTLNSANQCIDKNECLLGTDTCSEVGQKCQNTEPGFTCVCAAGYTGTGNPCTPCTGSSWGEQCNETCSCNSTNSAGCDSATGCECNQGWTGSDCIDDVDECALGTHNCVANANCTNTPGNFTCACVDGYADSNGTCVACNNNQYGTSCGTPCDCEDANAINSNQSCHHVTGRCQCKATWEGSRCETDIDECAADSTLCTNQQNQGCHNFDGGYECSCFVDFTNVNGTCVRETPGTTQPVPSGQVAIVIFILLDLNVSASDNLTISLTNDEYLQEVQTKLREYFQGLMAAINYKSFVVNIVEEGSLKVNATLFIADTDVARQEAANAFYGLRNTTLTVLDQSTSTQSLVIEGTTVDFQTDSETFIKCTAFLNANGQCASGEECVIENSVTVCKEKPSDNFALVLGLGVGLPLGLIAALIVALCVVYCVKRSRRHRYDYRSNDFDRNTFASGFFPTAMPTKVNTLGRNDPVYVPYDWDNESSVTQSSSDETHRKRRRRRRGEAYPVIDIEPSEYDNRSPQNFSWDFMYNYLGPDEKYQIQRPRFDRRDY